ncbi:hypothetical protein Pyn_03754 [Prunus yedoensis var. nudiflora]|uniref:Uncharacterized protein n=1 Tax=Prunus yedoensis var. nudiflora TaxID=2094558 RepID=A0A314V0J5_PRUYE|nr:hypothetical protein Pyn_03754 [Prunus yedoensis var. nudiflora]
MAVSRHLVSTTINCFSTPRVSLPSFILDDTYGVEDAFKVIGYQFLFDGCDLALVSWLMGFGWCNISMFFVLGFPKLFVWALCLS